MSGHLSDVLRRLRLHHYLPVLLDNGFDSWPVVCDITEDDLAQLGFKLGHRRLLQREIARSRRSPPSMTSPDNTSSIRSTPPPNAEDRMKRRYRRRPRPDINAPKKPKTAYVNFADTLRTDPAIASLSFVEIAREVGRQWQALAPEKKHSWECQAARAMQEYEAQMDEYRATEDYRRYQNYLRTFKQGQVRVVKRISSRPIPPIENDGESGGNSSETVSNDSFERNSRSHSDTREPDECRSALSLALQELAVKRQQFPAGGVPVFDGRILPPEDLIRKAAHSCSLGTGSLMFLISQEQLGTMLDVVFGPGPVDPLPLVIVLIMAAIGAHYDIDCMSDEMRHTLYVSATRLFDFDLIRSDYHRAMQVLLLLSVYSLMEKHMAIRHIVAGGLEISRWKFPSLQDEVPDDRNRVEFRRILCTLIFIDCWLSATLGYKSDVTSEDVMHAWSPSPESSSVTDAIYFHASKIGLVSRDIAEITIHKAANAVKSEHIELLTEKLDAWYNALPSGMHLAALTDDSHPLDLNFYQRRSIMMVHMFYLGAIISLYRQLLLKASEARIQSKWNIDMPYSQIQSYRIRCSMAAQQMARMMTLIGFSGAMTKRCWLMIYWSFHSCIVVLFDVAQQMLDHESTRIDEDLAFAKTCVDMLATCSTAEPVAAKHLGLILPLYNALCEQNKQLQANAGDLLAPPQMSRYQANATATPSPPNIAGRNFTPCAGQSPIGVQQKSAPFDTVTISIVKKLSDLLANPFSMGLQAKIDGARETSNAVGTYSVLWWK